MAIKLEDKKALVAEVQEAAKGALSAVVADARGVTVGNTLRCVSKRVKLVYG